MEHWILRLSLLLLLPAGVSGEPVMAKLVVLSETNTIDEESAKVAMDLDSATCISSQGWIDLTILLETDGYYTGDWRLIVNGLNLNSNSTTDFQNELIVGFGNRGDKYYREAKRCTFTEISLATDSGTHDDHVFNCPVSEIANTNAFTVKVINVRPQGFSLCELWFDQLDSSNTCLTTVAQDDTDMCEIKI